ncbi:DUF2141 domain-containing protein [Fulvivirga sedimenti]|uniref:DUF2141 domain-containing protein n=1 Tax=Fulvivirga sedimenti TaxID=2879465 RepID=A0A9X1HWG2_9BACT|nr:DUF2141 domain-containing protein [Fulvivirga sedimenti]MCA6078042.1 DUF2141 domain-containing protein [Fulvivirga sedimenti]
MRIYAVMMIVGMFITGNLNAQDKGSLKITVQNIKDHGGSIHVALYTSEDTFLELDHITLNQSAPVNEESSIVIIIENIPTGKYGLSIFHDVNDNGELDTNFMGIPKEPFGFGNDSMGAFGPPSFENASVQVEKGTISTTIKLKSIF